MSFLTVCRTSKYRQNTVDSSGTGQTSIDSSIYETPRSHRPYRPGFPKRYVSFDSNWVKQVPGQPRMFLERTYVRTINQSNTRVNNGILYRLSISLVPIQYPYFTIFKKSKTELTLDLKKSSEYGTAKEKEKVSLSQMGKRHTQAFIGTKRMNTRTNLYATNLDESGM